MPLVDNAWYVDSVGWTAVTAWATGAAITAGTLRRQSATPTVGNERVFVCIIAGTTHATTEPTWVVTRGAKTTDNTVTWQECTGIAAINGDATNTPSWTITATPPGGVKNTAVTLGQVIKRDSGASYQICTTAGTAGNAAEPAFSNTAGTTTADGTATWTSLGVVGNFTGNQAPHARLVNALTTNWAQAGNTVFVKSSHAETQSTTLTIAGIGTFANPNIIICHNGGVYPPLNANVTTGATITATAASGPNITAAAFFQGIEFINNNAGGSVIIGSQTWTHCKSCKFTLANNNASPSFRIFSQANSNGGRFLLEDVIFSFANVGQQIRGSIGHAEWRGGSLAGAAVPTTLLINETLNTFTLTASGVDLSAAGSGKTLVAVTTTGGLLVDFVNCKLNASVTVSSIANPATRVRLINCDSGTANYRNEVHEYTGDLTTETTIVRTGGASAGTPISWKIITTANAKFIEPFQTPMIAIWNDDTGSAVTATIEGIWAGGAVPNDDNIWVEVEYLGSAATPVSSFVTDAKASVLATAAAQTASSETWGGSTTDFKLEATFTPQMAGFVYARVKAGLASTTFYVDPKIILT